MMRFAAGLTALLLSACATHAPLPDLAQSPPGKAPAFDAAIAAFAEADLTAMPPRCATLFVGASSIRFWRSLKDDFPDRTVINRGFGGSTIWEVDHYFDRVVAPYQPEEIVFYAGENDLNAGLVHLGQALEAEVRPAREADRAEREDQGAGRPARRSRLYRRRASDAEAGRHAKGHLRRGQPPHDAGRLRAVDAACGRRAGCGPERKSAGVLIAILRSTPATHPR